MVTGFIITAHVSDTLRPSGNYFLKRQIDSIFKFCKREFKIIIIDNESHSKLEFPQHKDIIYQRIEDQTLEGHTGAFNLGIELAYRNNCDILISCNDDLWFDSTINNFIDFIVQDNNSNRIYGPVTNGVLPPSKQLSNKPYEGNLLLESNTPHSTLNGFCFAFTKQHYTQYRFTETQYFNRLNKFNGGGDGKWGGQEGQFIENSQKGLRACIVTNCFVSHDKIRGWKQLNKPGTGEAFTREIYEKKYKQ